MVCFLPFLTTGPTAFWRHCHPPQTARMIQGKSTVQICDVMAASRRRIVWEREGRETALAISNAAGLTLLTNGNGEGNVTQDQAMLISLGLVGAVRHPAPRQALVIGLGTGCTAGWLAEVPGMERVDVFELEPELTEMASRCSALNHDVLHHQKVQLQFGDGRQLLQTAPGDYDLIVSAPSNLFRAGMAGLFSQEFFRIGAGRLRPGGLFGLWVQVYQIDREAWRTILGTLQSVFPRVEGWRVALRALLAGRWSEGVSHGPPLGLSPLFDLLAAEAFAHLGDPRARDLASQGCALRPAEASLIEARFLAQTGEGARAAECLVAAFRRLERPPQACSALVQRGVQLAPRLAAGNPQVARLLFDSLRTPFFLDAWQEHRLLTRIDLGLKGNLSAVGEAFRAFEPHVPWNQEFLTWRARAYETTRDPLAPTAAEELRQFLAASPR